MLFIASAPAPLSEMLWEAPSASETEAATETASIFRENSPSVSPAMTVVLPYELTSALVMAALALLLISFRALETAMLIVAAELPEAMAIEAPMARARISDVSTAFTLTEPAVLLIPLGLEDHGFRLLRISASVLLLMMFLVTAPLAAPLAEEVALIAAAKANDLMRSFFVAVTMMSPLDVSWTPSMIA